MSSEPREMPATRGYQQEMLDESLRRNIIIALDTGSGKTLIAVLRMKHEIEREPVKISWFFAPTVALCQQQLSVITAYLPVSVGIVSGANEPDQWKDATLWQRVLSTHRVMVSTPQVFLDALRHGYISLGRDISLLVFDEAHHAVDNHPYNRIMVEFYFDLPVGERPMVLGLTASPIYGGNVERAFKTIESNLDSTIRAPRRNRAELATYVHPPVFKHIMYLPPSPDVFSTNLAALEAVCATLDIENDPYVISLRSQLSRMTRGSSDYKRIDQKLSKVISKQNSFTHKGLSDFQRAARDICDDIGPWAADWFVFRVIDRARAAANPFNHMMVTWKKSEKAYLHGILEQIVPSPVSYYGTDITDDVSDKTRALVECLLAEKAATEADGDTYSCIVFVQRRDAVLALAEVLSNHPDTKEVFTTGTLLGTSESTHRHAMMDITRTLVREEAHEAVLAAFKAGEKNLIISTAVAEEGIDIQACGSVIRWDLPLNMASWAQSKGRARKRKSTFTMMFEEGSEMQEVEKWVGLEERMRALYNDPSRDLAEVNEADEAMDEDDEGEDEDMVLKVESTGALLTLHSAISHLTHFCSVIPNTVHVDNRPLFDIDPPEFPEGWHFSGGPREAYKGPYGSTVTLPRALPLPPAERTFSVPRIYKSIISAHRHAAFVAYKALYEKGLLNDSLLPMTSIVEPELEEEVKSMLAEVEKRQGMSRISLTMDPWAPSAPAGDDSPDSHKQVWHAAQIEIAGLAPLWLFTQSSLIALDTTDGPTLYRPGGVAPTSTQIRYVGAFSADSETTRARLAEAARWTRAVFWGLNGTRMQWDALDFSYLFLPVEDTLSNSEHSLWTARRTWLEEAEQVEPLVHKHPLTVRSDIFQAQFGPADDITLVQRQIGFGRPFKFVEWRHDALDEEEELRLREMYKSSMESDFKIVYPLLVVEPFPPRSNFLVPPRPKAAPAVDAMNIDTVISPVAPVRLHFLMAQSGIILLSRRETEYTFLLPSVLRFLSMRMTALSMRTTLFSRESLVSPVDATSSTISSTPSPLVALPLSLLTTAITASSSGEQSNYQRLETLGDTVLKFICGLNLLAEYPLWHEGYLTRKKDHAVSNVRLAKEDVKRGVYQWIIRDIMLGKKWSPKYLSVKVKATVTPPADDAAKDPVIVLDDTPAPIIAATAFLATPTENPFPSPVNSNEDSPAPPTIITKPEAGDVPTPSNPSTQKGKKKSKKSKKKQSHQLSTKVLADVVESTIGAAYLHGGFDLGYEAIKFFDLGVKWAPMQDRLTQLLARVDAIPTDDFTVPSQLADVERMLGYTFQRKLLLIEALTHASYQQDSRTPSYERMEFLGDSVLDMIVTHTLYHAPGKHYSPGHIHLRKSAVVNAHILAFFCLRMSTTVDTVMPRHTSHGNIEVSTDEQQILLWKCLLHSSPRVLEDQLNAATRFRKWSEEIEESLVHGTFFPWAGLTRLQAPKFFSDMIESVIGAVFIDAGGSMEVAAGVIRRLGILPLLEHIIADDVDVLHPVSRLSLWGQKNDKAIEYVGARKGGNVSSAVLVDSVEIAREEAPYRGKPSQEEVKYNVAEKAIKILKLRDVGVGYEELKKKTTKQRKVNEQ